MNLVEAADQVVKMWRAGPKEFEFEEVDAAIDELAEAVRIYQEHHQPQELPLGRPRFRQRPA